MSINPQRRKLLCEQSIGVVELTMAAGNYDRLNLETWALGEGWDGSSQLIVTIPSSVNIWVNNTSTAWDALNIPNAFPNGLEIILDGKIMGRGGVGGVHTYSDARAYPGGNGGKAIDLFTDVTISINNTAYICGGGGGGAGSCTNGASTEQGAGGGGGAGGGNGGWAQTTSSGTIQVGIGGSSPGSSGGAGGVEGAGATGGRGGGAGGSGGLCDGGDSASGGGGGWIVPGSGGDLSPYHSYNSPYGNVGDGGSSKFSGFNGAGGSDLGGSDAVGGGGGGWGADGGDAYDRLGSANGGSGGQAIDLNGNTVTWIFRNGASLANNVFGAVS